MPTTGAGSPTNDARFGCSVRKCPLTATSVATSPIENPRTLVFTITPSSVSCIRTGRWVRCVQWSTASCPTVPLNPIAPVRRRGGKPGWMRTYSACTTMRSTSRPAICNSPSSKTTTSTTPSIADTGDVLIRTLTGRRATRLSVPSSSPISRSAGDGGSSSTGTSATSMVTGSSSGGIGPENRWLGPAVEQLRHQCGDRAAFAARERDVAEQRMAAHGVDHRCDAVVTADAQVVTLRDVVRQHDPASLTQARQRGQQHRLLEVLRLVEDHERVTETAPPDVREGQHFEQVARHDLVDDLGAHDRLECVGHGRGPR